MSSPSTEGPRRSGATGHPVAVLLCVLLGACQPSGDKLLRSGRADEVLATVRPVGAKSLRLRAAALRQLGRLEAARTELRLALAADDRSAEGHRLMGLLEIELGGSGAALRHFQRALELDRKQPEVRAAVARLLVKRALLRAHPLLAIGEVEEARTDLRTVGALDARLAAEGVRLLEALRSAPASRPASSAVLLGEECRGTPPELETASLPGPSRSCRLPARRALEEHGRRQLLVACGGARLALKLETAGCLSEAQALWVQLEEESPADPRWPLQVGRLLLAQARTAAARLRFTDHVFLSKDRSAAQLRVAELWLAAGDRRQAGAAALEALTVARRPEQQARALAMLRRCGLHEEARQAELGVRSRATGAAPP